MHFSDVFKNSFLEGFSTTDISPRTLLFTFGIACLFSLYVFLAYRVMTRKTFYDKSYAISLAAVTVIVTAIIITIQSSLVVSLGMVGALSIVRFRTAIKSPVDLMFMFWAIANGIICGAGLPGIALVASVVVSVGCIVLDFVPIAKAPMLLVVGADKKDAKPEIVEALKKANVPHTIKTETLVGDKLDMIIEIKLPKEHTLLEDLSSIEGVLRTSIVSHDGEITY